MKATDLMIGDWVYCTFWIQKRIERVWELKRAADDELRVVIMDEVHLVFQEKYFEPIPLTAEILEKNGFIRDGESWWYQDFRIVLSTSKGASLVCGRLKNFAFVHELQHALRLCGIEKEISI